MSLQSKPEVKFLVSPTYHMDLKDILKNLEFSPTKEQLDAITNVNGPQLIIAGPGSGKTEVLILRCLYLILSKGVSPARILICTFTEKAALSLQDRLRNAMRKLGVTDQIDLTELWVGTIHSICQDIINENLDETWLTKGYDVLDDITQQLFLYEHYYESIMKPEPLAKSKWPSIRSGIEYFSKITEDIIDVGKMLKSGDPKLESIARKYTRYEECLKKYNAIDFAHLQSEVIALLRKPDVGKALREKFDYVMVDEYQDTNYIQEQLFLALSTEKDNLCVVGDEDQSLYRFRGAVVQNFLNFPKHFKKPHVVKLETNFRSTPQIVKFVNDFVKDANWEDDAGKVYRYDKTIKESREAYSNGMESVYRVKGNSAQKIANLVERLVDKKVVADPNQIAILMKSVSYDGHDIIEALKAKGVKYYATRARNFFNLSEVQAMTGLLLSITEYLTKGSLWNDDLTHYYSQCEDELSKVASPELKKFTDQTKKEFANLRDSMKKGIADIFYEALAYEPFRTWLEEPASARTLSIYSDLLTKFQEYYHMRVINGKNTEWHRNLLFNSFLYSLRNLGLDEYEDPNDVFPPGYVQVMTIHQAKGLEFPVVIVYGLDKRPRTETKMDRELEPYSNRKRYEPYELVSAFDYYRLFYVAFSRAMDLLVLANDGDTNKRLESAFGRANELTGSEISLIEELKFRVKEFLPPKREFSITGHIHAYDICPRQYEYYGEYEFTGSRSAGEAFGTLVHYTIEDIHLHYLKQKPGVLNEEQIKAYFERNYRSITRGGAHPLAQTFRDVAFKQITDYYKNNKEMFKKLVAAEEPILVDRPKYVMSGVIDLIRGKDGELELLDFKAQSAEDLTPDRKKFYEFQLSIYAKMIERKRGDKPKRTYVYLTAEPDLSKALAEIKIQDVQVNMAEEVFDDYATKIMAKDFRVAHKPPRDVCRNCDFRYGCTDRIRFYPDLKV
jgi:DNA helicase-2/ATP-dependent DNA helicase PcrA